ncbi:G5 domain-containing protein [Dolosigranulum pigrum]|uniref:G5 domain-containing protein n=1 Tax=Dolosigranulum pigrum TaxID=29394 RepID=UPI001AD8930C|nr:G5 domain-containing protein [Dolosigranulum pigrum]
MVKNNNEQFGRRINKDKRYTLKKLSVGLTSVAVGTVLFLNGVETASGQEIDSNIVEEDKDELEEGQANDLNSSEETSEDSNMKSNENSSSVNTNPQAISNNEQSGSSTSDTVSVYRVVVDYDGEQQEIASYPADEFDNEQALRKVFDLHFGKDMPGEHNGKRYIGVDSGVYNNGVLTYSYRLNETENRPTIKPYALRIIVDGVPEDEKNYDVDQTFDEGTFSSEEDFKEKVSQQYASYDSRFKVVSKDYNDGVYTLRYAWNENEDRPTIKPYALRVIVDGVPEGEKNYDVDQTFDDTEFKSEEDFKKQVNKHYASYDGRFKVVSKDYNDGVYTLRYAWNENEDRPTIKPYALRVFVDGVPEGEKNYDVDQIFDEGTFASEEDFKEKVNAQYASYDDRFKVVSKDYNDGVYTLRYAWNENEDRPTIKPYALRVFVDGVPEGEKNYDVDQIFDEGTFASEEDFKEKVNAQYASYDDRFKVVSKDYNDGVYTLRYAWNENEDRPTIKPYALRVFVDGVPEGEKNYDVDQIFDEGTFASEEDFKEKVNAQYASYDDRFKVVSKDYNDGVYTLRYAWNENEDRPTIKPYALRVIVDGVPEGEKNYDVDQTFDDTEFKSEEDFKKQVNKHYASYDGRFKVVSKDYNDGVYTLRYAWNENEDRPTIKPYALRVFVDGVPEGEKNYDVDQTFDEGTFSSEEDFKEKVNQQYVSYDSRFKVVSKDYNDGVYTLRYAWNENEDRPTIKPYALRVFVDGVPEGEKNYDVNQTFDDTEFKSEEDFKKQVNKHYASYDDRFKVVSKDYNDGVYTLRYAWNENEDRPTIKPYALRIIVDGVPEGEKNYDVDQTFDEGTFSSEEDFKEKVNQQYVSYDSRFKVVSKDYNDGVYTLRYAWNENEDRPTIKPYALRVFVDGAPEGEKNYDVNQTFDDTDFKSEEDFKEKVNQQYASYDDRFKVVSKDYNDGVYTLRYAWNENEDRPKIKPYALRIIVDGVPEGEKNYDVDQIFDEGTFSSEEDFKKQVNDQYVSYDSRFKVVSKDYSDGVYTLRYAWNENEDRPKIKPYALRVFVDGVPVDKGNLDEFKTFTEENYKTVEDFKNAIDELYAGYDSNFKVVSKELKDGVYTLRYEWKSKSQDERLQNLKEETVNLLRKLGAPADLIELIQEVNSPQVIRQLASEFEKNGYISAKPSENLINEEWLNSSTDRPEVPSNTYFAEIDFEVEERVDDTLPKGERKVIQPGVKGTKKVIEYFFPGVDEPVKHEEILKESTKEIVLVGTKESESQDDVNQPSDIYFTEIPYKVEEREDNTLNKGERKVIQSGVAGLKKVTEFNQPGADEPEKHEEIIKQPTNEIVLVGTKESESQDDVNQPSDIYFTEIPYKVEEREDKTLNKGERKVIQPGVTGLKKVTEFNQPGANEPEKHEEILEQPTNEIVLVGTKEVTPPEKKDDFDAQLHKNLVQTELGTNRNDSIANSVQSDSATRDDFKAEWLAAYKERTIEELKAKGVTNKFVFNIIQRANTIEGIDSVVAELNSSVEDKEKDKTPEKGNENQAPDQGKPAPDKGHQVPQSAKGLSTIAEAKPAFPQVELDKLVAEERAKREDEIQKLPNLTQAQKDQFVAGLKKVSTVDKFDAILGEASKLNAAQPAKQADKKQADKKEDKKADKKQGERLPDTATGAWALGLVGASSILAGAGIKKFKK